MNIRDRIVELVRVPASELKPSPWNWRTHSKDQLNVIRGVLAEIGYAGASLARRLDDGTLELIDGHARAEVSGDAVVPVLVLDVNEDEAKKVLATFDPIGAMAGTDAAQLDALLREVQTANEDVASMLDKLATDAGIVPGIEADKSVASPDSIKEQYQILIEFDSESDQAQALDRLSAEGYKCRSLIS